jgi:low affinity Fe/Cu permease
MFSRFAHWASHQAGRAYAFVGAMVVILLRGISGPLFGFSDTWQLVINTGTTIITFLMVFLIQNTQNRDTQAIQLKLDELIRATQDARNNLMNLEDRSDAELENLKDQFSALSGVALEVSEAAKKVNES